MLLPYLGFVNKADINTGVHVPFQISVFIFTGCILRVELLDHMTVLSFLGGSVVKKLPARQEIWGRSLGQEDPLQKGMATQSSILAQEIPWTEEPGGLQSVGSQKVGHDGTQTIVLFKLLEKPPYGFPQCLHQFTVHQPCTRVSFSPHPHSNLQVLADFVILICISLMICKVQHLFNCISSLEKMSIKIFCPFFTGLFVIQILSCMRHLHILDTNLLSSHHLQIISPIHLLGCLFILSIFYFTV